MHDVLHVQGGEEGERTKLVRVFVCCAACTCVLHTNTRAHFHPSSFACELVESEVLPEPGSTQEAVFAEIDLATTTLFTVELCFNLFAHSEHRFHEFIVQRANWFDAFIVAISLFNVVLQATGASLPNAKVHAHTPSHAHALTCAETPAPECHKHKHKHRHARACVHAQRRIAAKRIITLPKHTHTHTHTHKHTQLLRLLRLGRVLRVFTKLENLQKLLSAICAAILPGAQFCKPAPGPGHTT